MARLIGLVCAVLVLAAVTVYFLGAVVVTAAVYGVYRGGRALLHRHARNVAHAQHQRAQLLARAELQHRWYLDGDPRGTYGRYTPAVRPPKPLFRRL